MRLFFAAVVVSVCALSVSAADEPAFYPFVIPWDDATPGTATDVSFLNTKPAGVNGPIIVKNGCFIEQNTGKRVRFVGTNITAANNFPEHIEAEAVARRMAKYGINLVRIHHMDNTWDLKHGSGIWRADQPQRLDLDPDRLDKLDYLIAQLESQGIYININLKVSKRLTEADGFPPSIDKLPWNYQKRVDNFDARMIELQKDYARRLLTHVNPYTQRSYADDPAVAVVEINNENSLVGFPGQTPGSGLNTLPEPFRGELAKLWNDWLVAHYADDAALIAAWKVETPPDVPPALAAGAHWTVSHTGSPRIDLTFTDTNNKSATSPVTAAVTHTDGTEWHAQLHVMGLNLRDGVPYTLTFRASTDTPGNYRLAIMRDEPDWRNNGFQETIALTEKPRDFRFIFSPADIVPGHTRLTFYFGKADVTANISDLKIIPGIQGPLIEPGQSLTTRNIDIPSELFGQRQKDWIQFLLDTERSYAEQMRSFLRDDLKVRANIIESQIAWGGLTAYDREQSMDFTDNHSYWQHPHFPGKPWDRSNWNIGNTSLIDAWAKGDKGTLPGLATSRELGKPFTVSEYDHPAPSDFAAESIPLAFTFAALQDWDAIYSFEYGPFSSAADGRISSFFDNANHPAKFAFYPAAAMIFRAGLMPPLTTRYVLQLPPRPYEQNKSISAAWHQAGPSDADVNEFFTHQWAVDPRPSSAVAQPTLLTQPVQTDRPAPSVQLRPQGDGGIWIAQSASAVIIAGRVGGQTIDLGEVVAQFPEFPGNFAVLTITAMDGKPLMQSKRILVTLVGRAENTDMGWNKQRNSVSTHWGKAPTRMLAVSATLTLKCDAASHVYPLSNIGKRADALSVQMLVAGQLRFSIDPKDATPWYEISAD